MFIRRGFIVLILFALSLTIPIHVEASCYSSGGGNGSSWLCGQVTAGGVGVADVSVSLSTAVWLSGSTYAYESVCTDSNGDFCFKAETDPATDCYTSYTYSSQTSSYCNWQSAQCSQHCYENDTNNYYSSTTFQTDGYNLRAYLPWDNALKDSYGEGVSSSFNIDFTSLQTVNVTLPEKSIIIRVRVVDGGGAAVTSGISVYVSGTDYSNKEMSSSFRDVYVSAGSYYVGGYCTNYENCEYACISNSNVIVSDGDVIKEVTLVAKKNSATISGYMRGDDGTYLDGYVSVGNYDYGGGANSCYSYGYDNASGGYYSISLPPGTYTMWCSPPYNYSSGSSGTTYSSREISVTLAEGEQLTKDCVLSKKDSSICGTVKDSNGSGLSNSWISAWTYSDEVNDWASAQSDSNGDYCLNTLNGQKYNLNASYWDSSGNPGESSVSNCSAEGMVTVESPSTSTNFTFGSLDHTVTFALVDSAGNSISGINGGGSIRPKVASSDGYWCGDWVSFDNGSATRKVSATGEYCIDVHVWGQTSYDPEKSETCFTAGASGASSIVNITMIPVDATISGDFLDGDGNLLTPDSGYISVHCSRGELWRECPATSSSYSCSVSAGRWCCGYWLDWNSGYASLSAGSSSSCIDVTAAGSHTNNLTFLKAGYIDVSVKDPDGNPMKWVWVDASVQSAGTQEETPAAYKMYQNNGCSTNADGTCKITIGGGATYYCNAYKPFADLSSDSLTLPEEVSVETKAGETTSCNLVFQKTDGQLDVTAVLESSAAASTSVSGLVTLMPNPVKNSKVSLSTDVCSNAFISCFSEMGGYSEATTGTDCKAIISCTSGDLWHCFGVNQLDNNLYISEDAEAVCVPSTEGATEVSVKLNSAGTIPDAITQTWDAGSTQTVSLGDNFSIEIPASAAADSGQNVTIKVQPDPIIPYQAVSRPTCQYGYDITLTDSNGSAITQFNADVTICIPLCDDQLALLDLEASDVRLTYRDTSTDAYINLTDVTIDDTNNLVCGKTNHLTEFALVGDGNTSGLDGDSETAVEESARTGEDSSGGPSVAGGAASAAGGCGGCYTLGGNQKLDDRAIWLFIILLFGLSRRRRTISSKLR